MGFKNYFRNKEGKISKTKTGVFVGGVGAVLTTLGALLQGNVGLIQGVQQLATEVAVVLGLFGIRDLPILNNLSNLKK